MLANWSWEEQGGVIKSSKEDGVRQNDNWSQYVRLACEKHHYEFWLNLKIVICNLA